MRTPVFLLRYRNFATRAVANLAVLSCVSAAIGTASAQSSAPKGADLLHAMIKAERTLSLSATETVTQRGALSAKMRVWRAGFKRRVEFLEPPVRRGDLLVDDGANVWLFHNSDGAAVQTKSTSRAMFTAGPDKLPRAQATVTGTATVAGRRAWIVDVRGRGGKRTLRRLWIDQATGARLRMEHFAPGGQRLETTALSNVRFGPVAASRFRWAPPAGAKVTRTSGTLFLRLAPARAAASWLQYPRVMPPGYEFESAVVDNKKGEAWLRYTNGQRRFSIFQQRERDPAAGGAMQPQQVDGGLYWRRGGSRLLGVDIPSALAEQVVRNVR